MSDERPLSGILATGSKVLMMASKDRNTGSARPLQPTQPPTQPSPKLTVMEQIDASLAETKSTLLPDVETYIASPPPEAGKSRDTHNRLAELLLQRLLKLDQIELPSSGDGKQDEARSKRREGVRWIQGLIDKVCFTHGFYCL